MTTEAARHQILEDVAQYLRYEIEEGRGTLERRRSPAPTSLASSPLASPALALRRLAEEIASCTRCELHRTRTQTVPGQGSPAPDILFIGEGPGADEDEQGLAFVGEAGRLLTRMIEAMGYRRDDVFIANVVKCRPPSNRKPEPVETEACLPYLREQIRLLKPKVIVTLGAVALNALLPMPGGVSQRRGRWLSFEGIDLMPTYHPAYLLRTESAKREVWEDLKAVLARLGRQPPPKPRASPGLKPE